MERAKAIIEITAVFVLLFLYENLSGSTDRSVRSDSDQISSKSVQTKTNSTQTSSKSVQTKTKSTQTSSKVVQPKAKSAQTGSKSTQAKPKPIQISSKSETVDKSKDLGIVKIGTQAWAVANLNVITFRNGDTIPEAKTNKEWVEAGESGKPAWCYYNNDPVTGRKYGKLYNWFAVNDPRELAPEEWTLASDADWSQLAHYLGGPEAAGNKLKSIEGWIDGNNGSNESGFKGIPGGYRIENGIFKNSGSIGTWWSSAESTSVSAVDFYLAQNNSLGRSSNPKQRGESVRCLRK
jgi:uncharacterized protein (TIGR02145 family)